MPQPDWEIFGEGVSSERARRALPILVRQARAQEPISYGNLARELGMRHHRPTRNVLGIVGRTMQRLTSEWGEKYKVPPIQTLVVDKLTGVPGEGVSEFLDGVYRSNMTVKEKRAALQSFWASVFTYPHWDEVLSELDLEPVTGDIDDVLDEAAAPKRGGESEEHRVLKEWIADHPLAVGLSAGHPLGKTEYRIASGDSIDVLFRNGRKWLAVEVKSAKSPIGDIARGLFQCLKYRVVLEAETAQRGQRVSIGARLALGGPMPRKLFGLANSLNVEVVENIRVIGA